MAPDPSKGPFDLVLDELLFSSPVFPVTNPESFDFLESPSHFYETLLTEIKQAKSQIHIASLYVGAGNLELQLLDSLATCLRDNQQLQCTILIDGRRGSRPQKMVASEASPADVGHNSSVELLHNRLSSKFPNQVKICAIKCKPTTCFLTRGTSLDEVFSSLLHMKIYIFDETLIISGANLADPYFVDRSDRYLRITQNPGLLEYFRDLIATLCNWAELPRKDPLSAFLQKYNPHKFNSRFFDASGPLPLPLASGDTFFAPAIQIPALGIHQDSYIISNLMYLSLAQHLPMKFCTAYFNLAQPFRTILSNFKRLSKNPEKQVHDVEMLMPAREANGFYGASGFKKYIPFLYDCVIQRFGRQFSGVKLSEYRRPGWTFHGKGFWLADPTGRTTGDLTTTTTTGPNFSPFLTTVGSSNYGERSVSLDMESQLTLVTRNPVARRKLQEEYDRNFAPFLSPFNMNVEIKGKFWLSKLATFGKKFL